MIKRIVRLSFHPEKTQDFEKIFDDSKMKIIAFDGCKHLELCRDTSKKNIYYTVSHWDSEHHLNDYRNSELFTITWAKTKSLFNDRPSAYSLDSLQIVEKSNL
jgi:quinol monooxygenase YgiN